MEIISNNLSHFKNTGFFSKKWNKQEISNFYYYYSQP